MGGIGFFSVVEQTTFGVGRDAEKAREIALLIGRGSPAARLGGRIREPTTTGTRQAT